MRKWNVVISAAVLILFVVHGIFGVLQLLEWYPMASKLITHTMLTLIAAHVVIGIILTAKTLRVSHKSGISYWKENALFWGRRLSGFVVLLLLVFHATAFSTAASGGLRLPNFDIPRLIAQLLFLAALAVHIISNIKPMLISFGVKKLRPKAGDIIFWISAVLLVAAAAFILYYIRWVNI